MDPRITPWITPFMSINRYALQSFNLGTRVNCLFISKIGDNSIDLPECNVLIQVSLSLSRLIRVSRATMIIDLPECNVLIQVE